MPGILVTEDYVHWISMVLWSGSGSDPCQLDSPAPFTEILQFFICFSYVFLSSVSTAMEPMEIGNQEHFPAFPLASIFLFLCFSILPLPCATFPFSTAIDPDQCPWQQLGVGNSPPSEFPFLLLPSFPFTVTISVTYAFSTHLSSPPSCCPVVPDRAALTALNTFNFLPFACIQLLLNMPQSFPSEPQLPSTTISGGKMSPFYRYWKTKRAIEKSKLNPEVCFLPSVNSTRKRSSKEGSRHADSPVRAKHFWPNTRTLLNLFPTTTLWDQYYYFYWGHRKGSS